MNHSRRILAPISWSTKPGDLQVYPIESVFGAVSIKSTLSSSELDDAYRNIASLKRLTDQRSFQRSPAPGTEVGLAAPQVIGAVLAYQAGRSLEAIAEQASRLDAGLDEPSQERPDFIIVLGEGIIGPRKQMRGEFNFVAKPAKPEDMVAIRRTGRHTLLRAYLQLLAELNALVLRDLDLSQYLRMPARVGNHLVSRNQFLLHPIGKNAREGVVKRITLDGIDKLVAHAEAVGPVPLKQHLLNTIGRVPIGYAERHLAMPVYEYNPKGLPPRNLSRAETTEEATDAAFQPVPIEIDGRRYAVDVGSLEPNDLEEHPEIDAEEFLSE